MTVDLERLAGVEQIEIEPLTHPSYCNTTGYGKLGWVNRAGPASSATEGA